LNTKCFQSVIWVALCIHIYDDLCTSISPTTLLQKQCVKNGCYMGITLPPSNLIRSKMNRDEDICPMKMKQRASDWREPKKNYNVPKSNKFIWFCWLKYSIISYVLLIQAFYFSPIEDMSKEFDTSKLPKYMCACWSPKKKWHSNVLIFLETQWITYNLVVADISWSSSKCYHKDS
jgi:hypothetical protein